MHTHLDTRQAHARTHLLLLLVLHTPLLVLYDTPTIRLTTITPLTIPLLYASEAPPTPLWAQRGGFSFL